MRSISRAALVLAASLVTVPTLHAQTSFIVAAGATVPIGDAANAYKMGYNASVGLGISAPLAPVGLRIEGMFNQLDWKGAQGNTRILAGIANATFSGPGMPMGYLIGGLGMYNMKASTSFASSSDTKIGFNIGGGLNIPLTGFGAFVEARLHYIATQGKATTLIPLTFGIKF